MKLDKCTLCQQCVCVYTVTWCHLATGVCLSSVLAESLVLQMPLPLQALHLLLTCWCSCRIRASQGFLAAAGWSTRQSNGMACCTGYAVSTLLFLAVLFPWPRLAVCLPVKPSSPSQVLLLQQCTHVASVSERPIPSLEAFGSRGQQRWQVGQL